MSDGISDMMREQEADNSIDKLKETNKLLNEAIIDIAKLIGMDTDGIGYDGLSLSFDDFKECFAAKLKHYSQWYQRDEILREEAESWDSIIDRYIEENKYINE